jgi:hypothetical protein
VSTISGEGQGDEFDLRYVIKNIGALPADSLEFSFKMSNMVRTEITPRGNRHIAPGGQIQIVPSPIKMSFSETEDFEAFTLVVTYKSNIGGNLKEFKSKYRTGMSRGELKNGEFMYHRSDRTEGEFTLEERWKFMSTNFSKGNFEDFGKYPGFSYHMIISIKDSLLKREKYIYDTGSSLLYNRISIFLDEENSLIFRIIDSNSKSYNVKVLKGELEFVPNLLYISCEFGFKKNLTFLQILVNGQIISQKKFDFNVEIESLDGITDQSIFGSNINGDFGGTFYMEEPVIYRQTVNVEERKQLLKYFSEKQYERLLHFKGDQWMKADKETRSIVQDNPAHQPTVNGEKISSISCLANPK